MNDIKDWTLLKQTLTQAVHDKQLDTLLHFLLTPEESQDLPKRLLLTKHLLLGEDSQRHIAEKTKISIAKITRGSNELKRIDAKFKQWLQKNL